MWGLRRRHLERVTGLGYNCITPQDGKGCMDLARFYMRFRGSVICVPHGAIIHKGIIHSVQMDRSTVTVWLIDNNPHRGHVGYRTLENFTEGASAWLEFPVQSWRMADAIVERAESQLGRLYDVLNFNCEHFVTLALGLEPESKQLRGLAWLAAGALVLGAIAYNQPQTKRRPWSRRRTA